MKYLILSLFLISCSSNKNLNYNFQHSENTEEIIKISEKMGYNVSELKNCLNSNKICGNWENKGKILLTGYYEPELNGSFKKNSTFKYPLYKRPDDLLEIKGFSQVKQSLYGRLDNKKVIPYYTREEISNGKLKNKDLELVWVDDPIEAFLMQIQGSGRVKINNKHYFIGYSAKNGHTYKPIGKHLLENGKLDRNNINLSTIEDYLRTHPTELESIFNYDTSFVFFEMRDKPATGSSGYVLPPMVSVASDPEFYQRGRICLLEFKLPKEFDKEEKLQRILVANLDTGGAIKGQDRMDLFTGFGTTARKLAGYMKQKATVYCLN